jgi:hypothetical protein
MGVAAGSMVGEADRLRRPARAVIDVVAADLENREPRRTAAATPDTVASNLT